MQEAWIQLQCPACEETWEENPAKLPSPDSDFTCNHCGSTRSMAEFARAARDLEILRDFHS